VRKPKTLTMETTYISFIKFGERKYMEKLFHEGEIYCNTINHFTDVEYENSRSDKYEGADSITQGYDLKIKYQDELIATAKTCQLYKFDPNLVGNIYCFYGIQNKDIEISNEFRKIDLNFSGIDWGDSAVFIFDTAKFLQRIEKAFNKSGFKYEKSPIIYYDHENFRGKLSPFHKRKEQFENHKELRYWIPNDLNKVQKVNIGNMSDIAFLISKKDMNKIQYDYK
jgi:hypothetical protein